MRGVGDFGRGGAGLGGGGDDLHGRAGADGGAARSDRDAHAADGGPGGGARDPSGRDRRSDDFRGRLAGALGEGDRASRKAGHGAGSSDGAGDGEIPSGAEALLSLFQPRASTPGAAPADNAARTGTVRTAGHRAAAPSAGAEAGDPPPADRAAARGPAPEGGVLRVLATSEPDVAALLAGQAPPPPSRGQDAAPSEAERPGAALAERVATRAEEALRADAAVTGPVTIAVPVPPGIDGIAGVSVTVTAGGLDVVLERAAGAAAPGRLAAAAEDLVARLQRRFPRGAVRVLEAARPDAAEAARPWAGWTST